MKKRMAKTLFSEGVLAGAHATRAIDSGYNLGFSRANGVREWEYLETELGQVRTFKTADAVLSTAEDIGFKKIEFNV